MIFFILGDIFNLVILLNLVIAIVSQIFSNVNSIRRESFYAERAELISDVWTIFPSFKPDPEADNRLLFFATEITVKELKTQIDEQSKTDEEKQKEELADLIPMIYS